MNKVLKIIVCISIVSVTLISLFYATILGNTTQLFPENKPRVTKVTVTLDTGIDFSDSYGVYGNGFDPYHMAEIFPKISSHNEEIQSKMGNYNNATLTCYVEVNGFPVEVENDGLPLSVGWGEPFIFLGEVSSYWGPCDNSYTFLTPSGGNITAQTPLNAFINLTYYRGTT